MLDQTTALRLESNPVNIRQWLLIGLLTIALVVDGLDVKIISYAAPLILKHWHISKAAFGPVLASALVGMTIGAGIGGWCGDRWGRRLVIVASLLLFGAATIASGLVNDLLTMTIIRFFSGLGFGAVTPNAYALANEWVPGRLRPFAAALISAGSPLGGMVGAVVTIALLPLVGWKGCFVVAGVATILLGFLSIGVPESTIYLRGRGRYAAAMRQWRRVFPRDDPSFLTQAKTEGVVPNGRSKSSIAQRSLLRLNIGNFVCFFCVQFVNYAMGTWGTVILTTAGLSLIDAIRGGFFYGLAAVIFSLVIGVVLRWTGSRPLLLINGVLLFTSIGIIAYCLLSGMAQNSGVGAAILLVCFALVGGVSGALITIIAAIASTGYPDECRATGVGFGVMAGRFAGVLSILAGGSLLTLGHDNPSLLLGLLAILALCITASAFIIDRHIASHGGLTSSGGADAKP